MEPYLGEIKAFAFGRIPKGWAACNGQLVGIAQNSPLFALLGTQYGGDGVRTFALPDLRGRIPVHMSATLKQATVGGSNSTTLTTANLPAHTHNIQVTSVQSDISTAQGSLIAKMVDDKNFAPLGANKPVAMATTSIGSTGNSEPVSNMQPYIGLSFYIATTGIFPPRD